jgi:polar amino acid transport system substrate-binding protein
MLQTQPGDYAAMRRFRSLPFAKKFVFMLRRRSFLLSLTCGACLLVNALTGCSSSPQADSEESTTAGQTLVMGTSADYPPYEFYETAQGDGEPIGFDIDIAKAITEQLGYELEISDMDFNGIIPALQSGRIDFAMAGMTPTEERKEAVDFSSIYYTAQNTIVAPAGSEYESYADLAGKKVGVQLGTIQETEAKEAAKNIEGLQLEPRNKISELIQEIKAGRLDAAIIEDTVARGYIEANPDLAFTVIPSTEEAGSPIAFPKDSPIAEEFEAALQELKDSGELDELVKKWFEDYYNEAAPSE